MNKEIKIAAWVTAIAISISLAGPLQAKDRGFNGNKQRSGHEIIVTNPSHAYGTSNDHYSQNDHHYYTQDKHYRKMMKKQKKMRKIRRLRRINTQYNWDHHNIKHPIIIISTDFFKY